MPVRGSWLRHTLPLLLLAAALLALGGLDAAHAAGNGPFGVGLPEAAVPTSGIFGWLAARQAEFYKVLTSAIRLLRTDPTALWTLTAMSFVYGVAHAAGPGHGKAVISAYVIANGETLRRGILLAFVSAIAQGIVAIVLIGIATSVLNLTSMAITDATRGLELTSGAAISLLGLYLLLTRLARRRPVADHPYRAPDMSPPEDKPAAPPKAGLRYKGQVVRAADMCAECGQMHMPTPSQVSGEFSWKKAASTVLAVGLRPCTGALIVLTFAFSLKLWWAGVLSVLAMTFGTGLTVAVLATLAVTLRDVALKFTGPSGRGATIVLRVAEIGSALLVLALGILILGASLIGLPAGGG
jgi:ABC-type nickel/cobalt efflux system permease component RcnA